MSDTKNNVHFLKIRPRRAGCADAQGQAAPAEAGKQESMTAEAGEAQAVRSGALRPSVARLELVHNRYRQEAGKLAAVRSERDAAAQADQAATQARSRILQQAAAAITSQTTTNANQAFLLLC